MEFCVKPVIVTLTPEPAPFAITLEVTPDPVVIALERALMLTIVPEPLLTSGLALGKEVSFAIGQNPPTSSTRSIILSLMAAVVAIVVSLSGNASPSLMVSLVVALKKISSARFAEYTLVSLLEVPDVTIKSPVTLSTVRVPSIFTV